jgi:hypothetical protein
MVVDLGNGVVYYYQGAKLLTFHRGIQGVKTQERVRNNQPVKHLGSCQSVHLVKYTST